MLAHLEHERKRFLSNFLGRVRSDAGLVLTRHAANLTVEDAGRYECRLLGGGQRRAQILPVSELVPKTGQIWMQEQTVTRECHHQHSAEDGQTKSRQQCNDTDDAKGNTNYCNNYGDDDDTHLNKHDSKRTVTTNDDINSNICNELIPEGDEAQDAAAGHRHHPERNAKKQLPQTFRSNFRISIAELWGGG